MVSVVHPKIPTSILYINKYIVHVGIFDTPSHRNFGGMLTVNQQHPPTSLSLCVCLCVCIYISLIGRVGRQRELADRDWLANLVFYIENSSGLHLNHDSFYIYKISTQSCPIQSLPLVALNILTPFFSITQFSFTCSLH